MGKKEDGSARLGYSEDTSEGSIVYPLVAKLGRRAKTKEFKSSVPSGDRRLTESRRGQGASAGSARGRPEEIKSLFLLLFPSQRDDQKHLEKPALRVTLQENNDGTAHTHRPDRSQLPRGRSGRNEVVQHQPKRPRTAGSRSEEVPKNQTEETQEGEAPPCGCAA